MASDGISKSQGPTPIPQPAAPPKAKETGDLGINFKETAPGTESSSGSLKKKEVTPMKFDSTLGQVAANQLKQMQPPSDPGSLEGRITRKD